MTDREQGEETIRRLPQELEIGVFAGRLEIAERPGDQAAAELVRRLRDYGVQCELVFRAPCG